MRVLPATLALTLAVVLAVPARAGDERDGDRREGIVKGLMKGIEALQALGGQDEAVAHLKRVLAQVKEGGATTKEHPEIQAARQQVECLGVAHKVLKEAGRHDLADVAERSAYATELAIQGRRDEEALRVRESAPPRAARAEALLVAAELLQARGEERAAKRLAAMAHELKGDGAAKDEPRPEKSAGVRPRGEGDEQRALGQRLELLRVAHHAAREAERADAAEMLERAIASAEVMLAGRDGPEALGILERTPPLSMLARVVNQSAGFWAERGHESKAAALKELSSYYAELAEEQAAEQGAQGMPRAEREERAGRGEADDVGAQLRALQQELDRLRRMIDELSAATGGVK